MKYSNIILSIPCIIDKYCQELYGRGYDSVNVRELISYVFRGIYRDRHLMDRYSSMVVDPNELMEIFDNMIIDLDYRCSIVTEIDFDTSLYSLVNWVGTADIYIITNSLTWRGPVHDGY